MAIKKPLVMGSDGKPQQLQAGDSLGVTSETGQFSSVADATLVAGNVVYATAAGHCGKAQANATGTADPIGLATAGVTSGASGVIQNNGVLTLTTTQWDAVAGTTGGLTFGTTYFLDPATAGKITSAVPTTVGQLVTIVGKALNTTDLVIGLETPILL